MKKVNRTIDMTIGNPVRSLIRFMLPMMVTQLLQQLYNMVDSFVVGRFIGEDALAAVGASTGITLVFLAFATGSGIGCSVIIAKLFGAGDHDRMKLGIRTATISMGVLGLILGLVGIFFGRWFLTLFNTPSNILDQSVLYLACYCVGLPFLFLYNILNSEFNAMGDSRTPLILLVICAGLNIILDLWFTLGLGMDVRGVAIATAISEFVSVIFAVAFMHRQVKDNQCKSWYSWPLFKEMIKVAVPSVVQQSIIWIGMLLVQIAVNGFGSSVLAGYTAALKIDNFQLLPMQAMGNAMTAYAGQNIGAQKRERISLGLKYAFITCLVMGAGIFVLIQVLKKPLLLLFLKDSSAEALDIGIFWLFFSSCWAWLLGMKYSVDGILRSVGELKGLVLGNFLNLGVRAGFALAFAQKFGVRLVAYLVPAGLILNFIMSWLYYKYGKWRMADLRI